MPIKITKGNQAPVPLQKYLADNPPYNNYRVIDKKNINNQNIGEIIGINGNKNTSHKLASLPKIDKLWFTIPCKEEGHEAVIKSTMKSMLDDHANQQKLTHLFLDNSSGANDYYKFAYRYVTPSGNCISIDFEPRDKGSTNKNYLKIGCNPSKLIDAKEGHYLTNLLFGLNLNGIDLDATNITRLDVCVDISADKKLVYLHAPGIRVSYTYNGGDGIAESEYVGSESSKTQFVVYDKAKELKKKAEQMGQDPKKIPSKLLTRVEVRCHDTKVSDLKINNPFEKAKLFVLPTNLGIPPKIIKWFLLAAQVQGLTATLADIKTAYEKKKYLDLLTNAYSGYWEPSTLFTQYQSALDEVLDLIPKAWY